MLLISKETPNLRDSEGSGKKQVLKNCKRWEAAGIEIKGNCNYPVSPANPLFMSQAIK